MKLWHIYGVGAEYIIRAETEADARKMAEKESENGVDKIPAKNFGCVEITSDGKQEIIAAFDDRCGY